MQVSTRDNGSTEARDVSRKLALGTDNWLRAAADNMSGSTTSITSDQWACRTEVSNLGAPTAAELTRRAFEVRAFLGCVRWVVLWVVVLVAASACHRPRVVSAFRSSMTPHSLLIIILLTAAATIDCIIRALSLVVTILSTVVAHIVPLGTLPTVDNVILLLKIIEQGQDKAVASVLLGLVVDLPVSIDAEQQASPS